MVSVRRILCPVDFSESSRHAFEYALLLARQFGAQLTAVHVIADAPLVVPYDGIPAVDFRADLEQSAREEMGKLLAAHDLAGVRVASDILHGTTYRAIAEYAAAQSCDLIVMGTHGRGALERAFFGSVTERVMKSVSCPVLAVPRLAAGARKAGS